MCDGPRLAGAKQQLAEADGTDVSPAGVAGEGGGGGHCARFAGKGRT